MSRGVKSVRRDSNPGPRAPKAKNQPRYRSYAVSAIIYHKLPLKVTRKLNASSKFGDEDLWAYFLNSKDVDWVWVRDHARDLVYEGWVQAFSVTSPVREIMLRDVRVYSNEGQNCLLRDRRLTLDWIA